MKEVFDFSKALTLLRNGCLVARDKWNGKFYLRLDLETNRFNIHTPYSTTSIPSRLFSSDLLARDWYEYRVGENK